MVGDVSVGKLADLVMWKPANFGVRPDQIIKGGVIAWAAMGDANAVSYAAQFYHHADECLLIVFVLSQSIPTVQPVIGKPMWGSFASVAALNSFSFVSKASIDSGKLARLSDGSHMLNSPTQELLLRTIYASEWKLFEGVGASGRRT